MNAEGKFSAHHTILNAQTDLECSSHQWRYATAYTAWTAYTAGGTLIQEVDYTHWMQLVRIMTPGLSRASLERNLPAWSLQCPNDRGRGWRGQVGYLDDEDETDHGTEDESSHHIGSGVLVVDDPRHAGEPCKHDLQHTPVQVLNTICMFCMICIICSTSRCKYELLVGDELTSEGGTLTHEHTLQAACDDYGHTV